MFLSLYYT